MSRHQDCQDQDYGHNQDQGHDQNSWADPNDSVNQRSIQQILALDGRVLHSLAALVEEVQSEMESNPDYEGDFESLGEGISEALVKFASDLWESYHGDEEQGNEDEEDYGGEEEDEEQQQY